MGKQDPDQKLRYNSIYIDDTKYKTQLTTKYKNRKIWEKPNDNLLTAYIPGLVNRISGKEGQKVKKGDRILTFEAMKMNNRVHAHKNARIKRIFVKVGDSFPRGTVLVELEPLD